MPLIPRLNNIVILTMFLAAAPIASAEVIKLRSGQSIEGKILKQDQNSILVDVGIDTPVTYFNDEIKEVLPDALAASVEQNFVPRKQADELEAQAVELIDVGNMDQGLKLIHRAIQIDPNSQRHMNYGSILFGNGVELYKNGKIEEAKRTLTEAVSELNKAIDGFDPKDDPVFMAQAYFLLGEMNANAFSDPTKAKMYYQKAVSLSDHPGAAAALQKLEQNSTNP